MKLSEKEKRIVIGVTSNHFETLEKEFYQVMPDDPNQTQKESKMRQLIFKIIAKLEQTKESKSSTTALNVVDYSGANSGNKELKTNGSNRALEPLNEQTSSISSAFE